MKLYAYWRSTSSYRLRIAVALKGLRPEVVPIHLLRDGGEQYALWFRAIAPQSRVPVLELDDGTIMSQSPAIIEWLEEVYPDPPLLPSCPQMRASIRACAAVIGCDMHPLHNAGPLNMLRTEFRLSEVEVKAWTTKWIGEGLRTVQGMIRSEGWCFGDQPTLADCYVVPALYAARRFGVPLDDMRRFTALEALAAGHPAFQQAHPAAQADAEGAPRQEPGPESRRAI